MRSKAYHAFTQKLSYFDDDLDLMDVLREAVNSGDLTDSGSYILRHVDPTKHTHIARRTNSDGSRSIVINHICSTLYSSYVKDIYEELTHYLRTILTQSSKKGLDSGRFIGEHSFTVNAKKVLELGNWDQVCQLITDELFQRLEAEKSTLKLLKKVANKLALNIDNQLIEDALPYLEARHFLVHTDGKVTPDYIKKYPQIRTKDDYLVLNFSFIQSLRSAVNSLVARYDSEVVSHNLLRDEDTQP